MTPSLLCNLERVQKVMICSLIVGIGLMGVIVTELALHYEGYFCKTMETNGNIVTINAWCGHNGRIITNSTGSFWHIEGWNFGDFP